MGAEWTSVPLGQLLAPARVPVKLEDSVTYQQVTVAIKGRGLRSRGVVPGTAIKTKRQYRVSANQLLVSKIDARNGGIGIVPWELDGAIVSGDFPTYDVDEGRCLPAYLDLCVRRPVFWEDCLLISEGSTNRVRLVLDEFLDLEVELPPIERQREVVESAATLSAAERAWSREAVAAERAHRCARVALIEASQGETVPLGEIVREIEGGRSPKCLDRPPVEGEFGVLKVSAIREGLFRPHEAKALPAGIEPWRQTVHAGDLLYSRANTAGLVGAMCRAGADFPKLLLCDKTMRVVLDEERVEPDYLLEAIGVASAREHIELMAGGTSESMRNISQAAYRETEIVLLPPPAQKEVARRLGVLRRSAHSAKEMSERIRRVRVALLDGLLEGLGR